MIECAATDMKRIPELDGLRGIAILMVLVWHYFCISMEVSSRGMFYLKDVLSLTWSGVDLFFVLSGFLIGGILLDARESPSYFKTFYARRVFRILPIYSALIGVYYLFLATGAFAHSPFMYRGMIPWFMYATFTQNFAFSTGILVPMLTVTWSLCVEEQFYLVLPTVVRFVPRKRLMAVLAGGILAAPVLRTILSTRLLHGEYWSFNMMPCRADALLLGVLAAMLVRSEIWEKIKDGAWKLKAAAILLALGTSGFVLAKQTSSTDSMWISTIGFSYLAVLYFCALLVTLASTDGLWGRVLRIGWLRGLGTISYGLYLVHWLVLETVFALTGHDRMWAATAGDKGLVLVALLIALGVATASWRFFEKPLLSIGHRWKYDRVVTRLAQLPHQQVLSSR